MKIANIFKFRFLLKLAVFVLAFYVIFTVAQQQADIQKKKLELSGLQQQTRTQDMKNTEIQQIIAQNNCEEYLEYLLRRDFNYSRPNEKVFVKTAGN